MELPIELAPEVIPPRSLFNIPVKNDMMKSYIPWMKARAGAKNDCPVGVAIAATCLGSNTIASMATVTIMKRKK